MILCYGRSPSAPMRRVREILDRALDVANILTHRNARAAAHRSVRELRPLMLAVTCPKLGLDPKSRAELGGASRDVARQARNRPARTYV